MSAPVVEIVVPADERADASLSAMTGAMVSATAEALSPATQVQIVERPTARADVVVSIQWSDGAHRRAVLRVHMRDGRDAERSMALAASDPDQECGRALGFAVAAMIPDDVRGEEAPPKQPPAQPTIEPQRETPPEPTVPLRSRLASRLWLDVGAQGTTGFTGSATAAGGGIAVRLPLPPFAFRLGGAARFGNVAEASASSTVLRADIGAGVFTVIVDPRLMIGARAGLVVLHHALHRTEPDGRSTDGSHALLGAETVAEVSFALSSRFGLLFGLGTEMAFGETRVRVGPDAVATIPVVRGVAELGARFAF